MKRLHFEVLALKGHQRDMIMLHCEALHNCIESDKGCGRWTRKTHVGSDLERDCIYRTSLVRNANTSKKRQGVA